MTPEVVVLIAGEGRNELGSRAGDPIYQTDKLPGVIEALLTRVKSDGWRIGGARTWRSVRKLRVGRKEHGDLHTVLGLALDAREAKCDALAFLRDRDHDDHRIAAITEGIRRALENGDLSIAGAVVIPKLEGWILALLGASNTEELSPTAADKALLAAGVAAKDGAAMVRIVESAKLDALPPDASALRAWLEHASVALTSKRT